MLRSGLLNLSVLLLLGTSLLAQPQAQTWNYQIGAWGALLTMESAAENAWVLANVATTSDQWIGLLQNTE